jgi:hypothetical protein
VRGDGDVVPWEGQAANVKESKGVGDGFLSAQVQWMGQGQECFGEFYHRVGVGVRGVGGESISSESCFKKAGLCPRLLVGGAAPRTAPTSCADRFAWKSARSRWIYLVRHHGTPAACIWVDHPNQRSHMVASLWGLLERCCTHIRSMEKIGSR